MKKEDLMRLALSEAKLSEGDIPVGAIVVTPDGKIVSRGRNLREKDKDPTHHAEIVAIRSASEATQGWRLDGLTLVSTLEPCPMCAGAIRQSRISKVIFGAWEQGSGAAGSKFDLLRDAALGPPIEVIAGVLEKECSKLLVDYFQHLRE